MTALAPLFVAEPPPSYLERPPLVVDCSAVAGLVFREPWFEAAQGRFDGFWESGLSEWDTAAGQAVLEAAGGRVLADDGQRMAYGKTRFLNGAFVAMGG